MKNTRLNDLFFWSEYQPDRSIDFNGWYWARPDGGLVVDPMPLDAAGQERIREKGGARWILVTSAEHLRASAELARTLDAEVLAPRAERERFGDGASAVTTWFDVPNGLPAGLAADVDLFALRGGKSPVEPALHLRPLNALYFGDLVRSHASGELCLLPDPKLASRDDVVASLRALERVEPEAVLLGDGDPLWTGAADAWRSLLARL